MKLHLDEVRIYAGGATAQVRFLVSATMPVQYLSVAEVTRLHNFS
jgi:hypothetical protein